MRTGCFVLGGGSAGQARCPAKHSRSEGCVRPFCWESALSGFRESPFPSPRGCWCSAQGAAPPSPLLLPGVGTPGGSDVLPGIWDTLAGNEPTSGCVHRLDAQAPALQTPALPGSCPAPRGLLLQVCLLLQASSRALPKSPPWLASLHPFWFLRLKSPSERCAIKLI